MKNFSGDRFVIGKWVWSMMGADAPIPPNAMNGRRPEGRPAAASVTVFRVRSDLTMPFCVLRLAPMKYTAQKIPGIFRWFLPDHLHGHSFGLSGTKAPVCSGFRSPAVIMLQPSFSGPVNSGFTIIRGWNGCPLKQ